MSERIRRRRTIAVAIAVATFASVALVSFLVTREQQPGAEVGAEGPPATRDAFWYRELAQDFANASRAPRTINGILLGDNSVLSKTTVCSGERDWGNPEAAFGTDLDPRPTHLPIGTTGINDIEGMTCDGDPTWVEVTYRVPGGREWDGRFGGDLSVYRFRGEPQFWLDYPTARLEGRTIAGRSAVVSPPLSDDGFGPSAIVIREPWGLTVVRADGITLDELVKVAEGIGGSR